MKVANEILPDFSVADIQDQHFILNEEQNEQEHISKGEIVDALAEMYVRHASSVPLSLVVALQARKQLKQTLKEMGKADFREAASVRGIDYIESPFKRGLDIAVAVPASAAALPLLAPAAVASHWETGNWKYTPVRQGHKFLKLRTIAMGKEKPGLTGVVIAEAGPVGRRLRRYGGDELPELWPVLKGEASIVGPRGLTDEAKEARRQASPALYDEWLERASLEARGVRIMPGMIDPPSLYGHMNPNEYSAQLLRKQMKLGLKWVENTSLLNDIKLISSVPNVMLGRAEDFAIDEDHRQYDKVA